MKKIACLLMVCLLVMLSVSALAAGTVNFQLEVPKSLDLTKDIPASEGIPEEKVTVPSGITFVGGEKGWCVNIKPADKSATPVDINGVTYYGCTARRNNLTPVVGAKYLWAIEVALTGTGGSQPDGFTVSGQPCQSDCIFTEGDQSLYILYFPIGELKQDGKLVSDTPATGDTTPILMLSVLLFAAVAGFGLLRKRKLG